MCEEKEGQDREEGDPATDGRSEETRIEACVVEEEECGKSRKLERHEGEEEDVDMLKQREM